jgi:hypothetical protein
MNLIDDDVFDEIILRRASDPDLLSHVATCDDCSTRFVEHRRFIQDLREILAQAKPPDDDEEYSRGERL